MYNQRKKVSTKMIYIGIIAIVSVVLTIPSMYAIKNVPGNSFSTEIDFIATALLVFGLCFLGIMSIIWLIQFLTNSVRLKINPSGVGAQRLVERKK